jgi:short-subunit dehydrogenase
MKVLAKHTALVTGASRGIGLEIAHALVNERMNVVLSGVSLTELQRAAANFGNSDVRILALVADLEDRSAIESLVSTALHEFGSIEVLINNAGVETFYAYHKLSLDDIEHTVRVNLLGTMFLTRLVLPSMLDRGFGHIINISSLSGKAGPPCCESYAATKAGLIAFTESLRAEYSESGIGFSVVCPGFVETGIYQRVVEETGIRISRLLGTSAAEDVAKAVIRAIKKNSPEVIINPGPTRMLTTLAELSPRLGEKLMQFLGVLKWFKDVAATRERKGLSANT